MNKRIIHLLTVLLFTAIVITNTFSQDFNIEVVVNYLDIQIVRITGESYDSWNLDTIDFDSVVYMEDSAGIHIVNLSNVPVAIDARISDDTTGFPVPPGYTPWYPTTSFPSGDNFVLEGVFSDWPIFPPDTTGAVTIQGSLSNILSAIPVGDHTYLYLIFQPPAAPSDLYTHRLLLYLVGRINLY